MGNGFFKRKLSICNQRYINFVCYVHWLMVNYANVLFVVSEITSKYLVQDGEFLTGYNFL